MRPKSPPIASQLQKEVLKNHQKEAKSPTPSAINMTTTRSQSLAMSSSQGAPAPHQPESPETIPGQEKSLSPEWTHAITNLLRHSLTSEIVQMIKKWIFYQGILEHTDHVIVWNPIEFGEDRNLQ